MERKITLKIDKHLCGCKIEDIMKCDMRLSSAMITRLKQTDNGIMLNGLRDKTVTRVKIGDILEINVPPKKSEMIKATDIPLDILYEDEDVLVVNKPMDMPTHTSRRHTDNTLANAVMYHYNNENSGFHSITRLDRNTSGAVLIAKNPFAANILSEQMKSGKIEKEYIAIVHGIPTPERGVISAPIKKAENDGIRRIVSDSGKEAVTKYCVIKSVDGLSVVRLIPVTGRTHQLRVHMQYINTPIYGDELYSEDKTKGRSRLHCSEVSFFHPVTNRKITVTASLPDDMLMINKKG